MNRAAQLLILTILFIGSSLHAAEGVRALPDTAEAMGLMGGRLTILDDASVVRTNPANLTKIHDTTYTVTYQPWHGKTDFVSPTGVRDSMIIPWKNTGSLYYATPINDTLSAGLGVSAPFGISINWPAEGAFRYAGAYDAVLQSIAINPALGLKLNDDVSIGVGLDIMRSKLRLEQRFPWGFVVPGAPDGKAQFDGEGWGIGAYVGLNIDIGDRHHLAFVGRLPVSVDYEGDFELSNPAAPGSIPLTPFMSEIEHPGSVGVGYAFDVSDRLSVGVDFEWLQNSTHDDVPLNIGANQPLLGGANTIPLAWDDSISIGVGAEFEVNENLTLRAGYQYADSPMNSRTYNPSVPADDRHIVSVGAGYTWGQNSLDVAYSFLTMDSSTIAGNAVSPAFNGNYDYRWDILTISYSRTFWTFAGGKNVVK
jgi:long-chain fatty acid transport protein